MSRPMVILASIILPAMLDIFCIIRYFSGRTPHSTSAASVGLVLKHPDMYLTARWYSGANCWIRSVEPSEEISAPYSSRGKNQPFRTANSAGRGVLFCANVRIIFKRGRQRACVTPLGMCKILPFEAAMELVHWCTM
uniref:Uncharacterized protein n=1 Tax=Anopheles quadriannulatus TaxID=34691 RepID=A0A182XR43_ANOQN